MLKALGIGVSVLVLSDLTRLRAAQTIARSKV